MSKDYFGYAGKNVVVTGAASGMGKAASEMLVELGANVYALDMNEVDVPGIKMGIKTNLSQKASIDAAFAKIPDTVDKFFGIAGLAGMTTDYWTTVTVNYVANVYIIENYLEKRMPSGGAIAIISSTAGLHWERYPKDSKRLVESGTTWEELVRSTQKLAPKDGYGPFAYVISKRSITTYITKKADSLARKNIRANCLLPGVTGTGLTKEFLELAGGMDNMMNQCGMMHRMGESREMGEPVVFLNSDMASYITGAQMIVDGGEWGLKSLKMKPDPIKVPVRFKIFHTRLVKYLIMKIQQKLT